MSKSNKITLTERQLDLIKRKEKFIALFAVNPKLTECARELNVPLTTIKGWLQENDDIRAKYDAIIEARLEKFGEIAEQNLENSLQNDKSGWLSLEVLRKRRKQHWGNDNNINLSANLIMNVPVTMRKETDPDNAEEAELLYNSESDDTQS